MSMKSPPISFAELGAGTPLEPFTVTISAAANDRYWDGAGVEHPLRRAGALYPLIAANLTVLTFANRVRRRDDPDPPAPGVPPAGRRPATLRTTGSVSERYERRGRTYVVVETEITLDDDISLWTSTVVFTPAAQLEASR